MCKHGATVSLWKSAMRAVCVWLEGCLCLWMDCTQQMAQISPALITALSEWDAMLCVRQHDRPLEGTGREGLYLWCLRSRRGSFAIISKQFLYPSLWVTVSHMASPQMPVFCAVFCEDRVVKLFGCLHLLLANMFTSAKASTHTSEALFSVFSDAPNKCTQLLKSKDAHLKGTLYFRVWSGNRS